MILDPKLPLNFKTKNNQNTSSDRFNLQAITVWTSSQKFIIQANYKKQISESMIEIDRNTKQMIQKNYKQVDFANTKPHYFSFFVGILDLSGAKIIVLVQQAQFVCTMNYRDIFKIIKPIFLFFNLKQKANLSQENAKLLINITSILEQGMYFSFTYDLCMHLNTIQVIPQRREQYNWAGFMQKSLKDFDKYWSIPLIQGFVNKIQIHLNGQKFSVALISRRSTKRSGTQQYKRGVDFNGNVANYVQTQQFLTIDQFIFSFVQARGTVPIFWKLQKSYGGMLKNVVISNTMEQNYEAFQNHLKNILKNKQYKKIYILNLLCSKKAHEKKLIQNYQYLILKYLQQNKNNQPNSIKYGYFDVHTNCPNKKYLKMNAFLQENFNQTIQKCQFNAIKIFEKNKFQTLNHQKGIIRTNCSSCIDRSNIAQFRLATLSMIFSLKHLHMIKAKEKLNIIKKLSSSGKLNQQENNQVQYFQTGFINSLKFLTDMNNPFTQLYRNLWADNGDYLSKQYTGTGSTQSFAVRKGTLSYMTQIDHGMKSLQRALRNVGNQEKDKNDAIEFMLGIKN